MDQQEINWEDKYNQLENEYNDYKFDVEFSKDLSGIKADLDDNKKDILKNLKATGNIEAYNMMLDTYKAAPSNTGGLGNFPRNYGKSNDEVKQDEKVDMFSKAIKEAKEIK